MNLKRGDIFTIPLKKARSGFGQIVSLLEEEMILIVIYDLVSSNSSIPNIDEVVDHKIVFLGYTLDAKFFNKSWRIIGNSVLNLKGICMPYYKIGTPPTDIFIVDFTGKTVGTATREEFDKLDYQNVLSPALFEDLLKAHIGEKEWKEDYDELLYSRVLAAVEVIKEKRGL